MNLKIVAMSRPWMKDLALYILQEDQHGRVCKRCTRIEFQDVDFRDGVEPAADLSLGESEAQQLADQLWRAGVRPSEAAGSVGALQATTNHLLDMRAIAFAKLEVDKP